MIYAGMEKRMRDLDAEMERLKRERYQWKRKGLAKRAVRAVNAAFPVPDADQWDLCERLLPHALACVPCIHDFDFRTGEAFRLLDVTAQYLRKRARYAEAVPLRQAAVRMYRAGRGAKPEYVATTLGKLAGLYSNMGCYDEAARHLAEALEIDRKTVGEAHSDYVNHLAHLACARYHQKRFDEAATLHKQALDITRRTQGAEHPHVAICCGNLANVYGDTGRYAEAETLLMEALAIVRKTVGEAHLDFADCLLYLGRLYVLWNRLADAEPLHTQALQLCEQTLGPEHLDTAQCYVWLGYLRYRQGRSAEALACYRRALPIEDKTLGPQHPNTTKTRVWIEELQREMT